MQQGMASSADAELILKLYELRTETVMRQARAWMAGEFWPETAADFFAIQNDPTSPKNAYLRQVVSYWEMAASLVLHGALSADLYVDCNAEPFFLVAKLSHILPEIHQKFPNYFSRTLRVIEDSQAATTRYEMSKKNVAARREAKSADWLHQPKKS